MFDLDVIFSTLYHKYDSYFFDLASLPHILKGQLALRFVPIVCLAFPSSHHNLSTISNSNKLSRLALNQIPSNVLPNRLVQR